MLYEIFEISNVGVIALNRDQEVVWINLAGQMLLQDALPSHGILQPLESEYSIYNFSLHTKKGICYLWGEQYTIEAEQYNSLLIIRTVMFSSEKEETDSAHLNLGLGRLQGKYYDTNWARQQIARLAKTHQPVLIEGAYGTEKTIVARAIHEESPFQRGEFHQVDCKNLLERLDEQIFGVSGLDTKRGKAGSLERSGSGTLLLENIEYAPIKVQRKLLCLLETGQTFRCGSSKLYRPTARIIVTAQSGELKRRVEAGEFLPSLYLILGILRFTVPALADGPKKCSDVAVQLLCQMAKEQGKQIREISESFKQRVDRYSWPGNQMEMERVMAYIVAILEDGVVTDDLLPEFRNETLAEQSYSTCQNMERSIIEKAIIKYGSSVEGKRHAARELGIGMSTLYRKIKEYGLN